MHDFAVVKADLAVAVFLFVLQLVENEGMPEGTGGLEGLPHFMLVVDVFVLAEDAIFKAIPLLVAEGQVCHFLLDLVVVALDIGDFFVEGGDDVTILADSFFHRLVFGLYFSLFFLNVLNAVIQFFILLFDVLVDLDVFLQVHYLQLLQNLLLLILVFVHLRLNFEVLHSRLMNNLRELSIHFRVSFELLLELLIFLLEFFDG